MLIRNLLFVSVSAVILTGTANAGMNFLPDLGESGLGVKGKPSIEGDNGREINMKGCEKEYQATACAGATPFETKRVRAENGQYCYQCRAFEPNDCQEDDFYPMSVWNAQKPTASLNLPKSNLFAEVFGNIFGFRNAVAITMEHEQLLEKFEPTSGGGGGGGGTIDERPVKDVILDTGPIPRDPTKPSTIAACTVERIVVDKIGSGSVYTFKVTDTCKYNDTYVKGVWEASCDPKIYKYDSSKCSDILAGNKCGEKWDGCYTCGELYMVSNADSCKMPLKGVYEKNQTKVGSVDIAVDSCSKTPEGCLHSCLAKVEASDPCTVTGYPHTSSSCSGKLSGISCTTAEGFKRHTECTIATCNATTHPYTADNCSSPNGLNCKDTVADITRYKLCRTLSCSIGYSKTQPSFCSGSIVTDKYGCFCCNERNGKACLVEAER